MSHSIRSTLNSFLRRLAQHPRLKDSALRKLASQTWGSVLTLTGSSIDCEINGHSWRLINAFRHHGREYEREAFNVWVKLCTESQVVWDVGANIGLYSIAAARSVPEGGKVTAWEPTPATFSILEKHLSWNKCSQVVAVQEAISDCNKSIQFFIYGDHATNRIALGNNKIDSVNVQARTLDYWLNERGYPDLLKIDIEGAEVGALRGAEKLLSEARPVILIAVHPQFIPEYGETPSVITELIAKHSYFSATLSGKAEKPEAYSEYLLLPTERKDDIFRSLSFT